MERAPGLLMTAKTVMFRPTTFFRTAVEKRSATGPITFAIVISIIPAMIGQLLLVAGAPTQREQSLESLGFALVASAAMVLVAVILEALVCHGLLVLLRARPKPFSATLGCICYAQAPGILLVVPFLGAAVATIWSVWLQYVAVRNVHGASRAKAAFAILALPAMLTVALIQQWPAK